MLLRDDDMGFSLHDTVVEAGAELTMEYRHHLGACYCLEGEAEFEDLANGELHRIVPGTLYALNQHDRPSQANCYGLRIGQYGCGVAKSMPLK